MEQQGRSKNTQRILIIAAAALALAAVFLLLDFRVMRGTFRSEHTLTTMSFGSEGPQTIAMNQPLDVYIQGPAPARDWLANALIREIEQNPYVGSVNLCSGEPEQAENTILVVRVDGASVFWAAVFGRSRSKIEISYATNGSVDWMDDEVIKSEPGPYAKWIRGTFEGDDTAFGLMSLRGYYSYLGQQFGAQINSALRNALET
ncbi:MAG: hypothetical protein GX491_05145 [Chloroflexi bacterium]|nr:hypothetical protein [Chloroflexota bacterium]